MVSFGVARKFDNEPNAVILAIEQPLTIDSGPKCERVMVRIFRFDPTLAPEGKTVITVMIATREHNYWDNLKRSARNSTRRRRAGLRKRFSSYWIKDSGTYDRKWR